MERRGFKKRTQSEANGGVSPEQEKEVCRRYKEGESTVELAKSFEVMHSGTISSILKRNGVKLRTNSEAQKLRAQNNRCPLRTDKKTEEEVCRRYKRNKLPQELSKDFGLSAVTIRSILKRNGVKIRTCWESRKITGR